MKTPTSNRGLRAATCAIVLILSSCTKETEIGRVHCDASKTFSISSRISSKTHPSRHVYFEPLEHNGYSEAIYDTSISSLLTNKGEQSFVISASWSDPQSQSVEPGSSIVLPTCAFKDFRIVVFPSKGKDANVDFDFTLNEPVTTDSTWRLTATWADGP